MDEPLIPGAAVAASPFEAPSQGFFIGGHRGRQLEELRHLSRWSRRLLAVTGDRGVGKSSLYRALSARLDTGVKAARINANLTSDTREVLHGLLQGFGVASPANANAQLLSQLITVHVEEQVEAKRHCLVLVDDAHLLDLRALEQLLHLVDATSEDALRIVFFAEAYFIAALDKATKRMSTVRTWHEIRLMPFSEDDTRAYLNFRLQEAGVGGRSPFSAAHVKLILDQSGGLPGHINELATAILSGEISIRAQGRWLPPLHRAVALLLVAVFAGAWLAWTNYQDDSRGDSSPPVADAASPSSTDVLALPDEGPAPVERGGEPAAESVVGASAIEPSRPIDAPRPQAVALAAETPDPDVKPGTALPAEDIAPLSVTVTPPPAAVKAAPTEIKPPPVAVKPAPVAVKPAAVAPAPVSAAPPVSVSGGPYDVEWVFDQPDNNYTLQLFGTSNRARWQAFVDRQKPGTPVASFETRREGQAWYVAIFGSFPSQAAAEAAAARLPASIGKVAPWVRTFKAVRATIVNR